MAIEIGDKLPEVDLILVGEARAKTVGLPALLEGRKVVIFALAGAFTGTCSTAHLPSFIRTAGAFRDRGIDDIYCVAVNDPFVLGAWAETTGARAAGITMLGDAAGELTRALGMEFTAPPIGLYGRSNRYAIVVDDGVVTHAQVDKPGECSLSTGEALLAAL